MCCVLLHRCPPTIISRDFHCSPGRLQQDTINRLLPAGYFSIKVPIYPYNNNDIIMVFLLALYHVGVCNLCYAPTLINRTFAPFYRNNKIICFFFFSQYFDPSRGVVEKITNDPRRIAAREIQIFPSKSKFHLLYIYFIEITIKLLMISYINRNRSF